MVPKQADSNERRRIVAELEELVRRPQVAPNPGAGVFDDLAPRAKSEELKKPVRSAPATPPQGEGGAHPAHLVDEQSEPQKIFRQPPIRPSIPKERRDQVEHKVHKAQERDLRGDGAAVANSLDHKRRKLTATFSEAVSGLVRHETREANPRHRHERIHSDHVETDPTRAAARRWLLVLAGIIVVCGLAGLAATLRIQSERLVLIAPATVAATAESANAEESQDSLQADAPDQHASLAATPQEPSPAPIGANKAEPNVDGSQPQEKASPNLGADGGSASDGVSVPAPSAQMRPNLDLLGMATPLGEPTAALNAPPLPAGAFSAKEASAQSSAEMALPSSTRPAAPASKRARAKRDQSANARVDAPETVSNPNSKREASSPPRPAAKRAVLPPSRPAAATPAAQAPAPNSEANEAKQEEAARPGVAEKPPQAAAQPAPGDEYVVQRALNTLFKGSEEPNPNP